MSESLPHAATSGPGVIDLSWLDDGVVITVNSNKGGVGKTTVVLMLAYYLVVLLEELGEDDFEILMVDWDPQCNLSTCFGFHMDGPDGRGRKDPETKKLVQAPLYSTDDIVTTATEDCEPGWAAGMIESIRWVVKGASGKPIRHAVSGETQPDPINKRLKLIPGHPDMEDRYTLVSQPDFRFRLDHSLEGIKKRRIILIDTGPGMGPLVESAWAASDHIIGVAALYYNEMEGVLKAKNKIKRSRKTLGRPALEMDGIVVNEYSDKKTTQKENLTQLIQALGAETVWVDQAVPDVEQIAQVVDQGKSFGRLSGGYGPKKKINDAGMALARKVLEVVSARQRS